MNRRSLVVGLGLRVLAGVALYFLLVTLWLISSLDKAYDQFVLELATAVVPALTHFPIGSSEGVDVLDVHNRAFILVLIISLALVARGLPWKRRLAHYAPLLAGVVLLQIFGLALQLYLALVLKSQGKLNVSLLLPWEIETVKWMTQTVFLVNVQVTAFLAIVLTVFWSMGRELGRLFGAEAKTSRNAGGGKKRKPNRDRDHERWAAIRRSWLIASAGVLLVVACATTAWWVREFDGRHAAAHLRVGDAFAQQHMMFEAEGQYRAALRGAGQDGRTWMMLAMAVQRQGRKEEALNLLNHALEVVTDPNWRQQIEQARIRLWQ